MILSIENVCKNYGHVQALNGFSVTLTEGVYALLGPNGAGKSTLMNILVGNITQYEGDIKVDGVSVKHNKSTFQQQLGYIPQQLEMPGYFTVERFLYYVAALKGIKKEQAQKQIEEGLELVHLKEKRSEKIHALSGGMKQRLYIAQAVLGAPKILIMDEPTAGLDPKERIRIRNLIAKISMHRIVLIATHIVSDIECIAKEILFIKKGQLIERVESGDIENHLKSKVYERRVRKQEIDAYLEGFFVSAIQEEGKDIKVRFLSNEPQKQGDESVSPRLEDMYLYLFGKDV